MKYFSTKLMQAVVKDPKTRRKLLKAQTDREYEQIVLRFAREHDFYVSDSSHAISIRKGSE
jgi:hypothetical protein